MFVCWWYGCNDKEVFNKMALAQSLYEFFEIEVIGSSATFADLITNILQVGIGVWLTMFIGKCLFLATTISGRKFY